MGLELGLNFITIVLESVKYSCNQLVSVVYFMFMNISIFVVFFCCLLDISCKL